MGSYIRSLLPLMDGTCWIYLSWLRSGHELWCAIGSRMVYQSIFRRTTPPLCGEGPVWSPFVVLQIVGQMRHHKNVNTDNEAPFACWLALRCCITVCMLRSPFGSYLQQLCSAEFAVNTRLSLFAHLIKVTMNKCLNEEDWLCSDYFAFYWHWNP